MVTHSNGAERFRPDGMPVGRPFPKGTSGNPGGRERVLVDIHALAKRHTAAAIGRLVELMEQKQDLRIALEASAELLSRGWGKPPVALYAQVNSHVAVGGIDRPPRETLEEWLARRRRELGALG